MTTITYTPPPTVGKFIRHYLPGELFLDWIMGPVGSGKTTGIFFKLVRMAQLQDPSPVDGIRRSRCVVVRNTMQQLKDTTIKSWDYWFKDGQAGTWHTTDKTFMLRFGDVECEVLFRPLDTPDDVQRVLSLEVTFAICDEYVELPKAIIEALSARCGRYPPAIHGGATNWGMWGASNPGLESSWWYPMLVDPSQLPDDVSAPENWTFFEQPSGFSPDAENIDNLPGKAGYYTNLAKGKTMQYVKQFIEVQWGYSQAGKPVFPMFRPDLHMSTKPLMWNPRRPLLIGYDPGLSGSGWVFGQYIESVGRVAVLAELPLENYTTERAIKEKVKPLLAARFPGADVVIVPDPASANRSQSKEGASVLAELRKHFRVAPSSDKSNSIDRRINSAVHYMMTLTGEGPALIIDPSCVHLKRALISGYRFDTTTDGETKEKPAKNKASHISDAFMYLTLNAHTAEERAGAKKAAPPRQLQQFRGNSYAMR